MRTEGIARVGGHRLWAGAVFYLPGESTLFPRVEFLNPQPIPLEKTEKLQVILLRAKRASRATPLNPLLATTLRAFHSSPFSPWLKIQE
jgi:hypothetical protein